MKKTLPIVVSLVLLVVVGVVGYALYNQKATPITTFEECAAANNKIQESYPPVCVTKDGKSFTANVGNAQEMLDQIVVTDPTANQIFTSPATIAGRARDTWFFEGNMPATVFDANGKELGTVGVYAEGNWQTSNFVNFTGRIEFTKPTTKTGTLVVAKDNPSGKSEMDAKLEIPVVFE